MGNPIDSNEEHEELLRQIKALNKRKSDCSHSLGAAIKKGEDTESMRSDMRIIKDELKALKLKKISLLEQNNVNTASSGADSKLPPRFAFNEIDSSIKHEDFRIVPFTENLGPDWDRFVRSHPNATPYHFSSVRKLISETFNKADYSILAVNEKDEVTGVLPLVRIKSMLFGDFLVSMPYFNYGGMLALSEKVEQGLLERAIKLCQELKVEHMEIREMKPRDGMAMRTEKVSMLLGLPDSFNKLMQQLGSKTRAQVNRAEKENVNVRSGGEELLHLFYKVFSRNMRDLGTPVYDMQFFRALLGVADFETRILIIELDGKPVAAAFLLGYGDVLEIPWASSLRTTNALGMNMYLYSKVLEYAIEKSYRYFDFGRSSVDSGTYRFKQQWGAKPQQNYWHYWLDDGGEIPQLNPSNPKYEMMIAIWKRLPVAITNIIGPRLVKNLP